MYKSLPEASEILKTPENVIKRLLRLNLVPTKIENGITLINVPETAQALGIDIEIEDATLETASLALVQRRIKRLDVQTLRDRLAYQERIGRVLTIEEVEQGRVERVRVVRSVILGMSRTLPIKLVGKGLTEITTILDTEARRILGMFSQEAHDEPE